MAVLTYKGGKYRNLAGNKIFDGARWQNMTSDSKIFIDGAWHDFSWAKAPAPDAPSVPELPDWDSWEHLATEEPTNGNVLFITPSGNGKKDGSSWSNAFSAEQIHVAMLSLADGGRLYMAEGDYGTIDRPLSATGTVTVCGGFVEGDYSWNTRDAFRHPTFFKGGGFAEGTAWILDGISVEGASFAAVNAVNVTATDSAFPEASNVFSNCRFSGGGFRINGASADRCYIAGNDAADALVCISEISNSALAKCTSDKYESTDKWYELADTVTGSVLVDIHNSGIGTILSSTAYRLSGVSFENAKESTLYSLVAYWLNNGSKLERCSLIGCHIGGDSKVTDSVIVGGYVYGKTMSRSIAVNAKVEATFEASSVYNSAVGSRAAVLNSLLVNCSYVDLSCVCSTVVNSSGDAINNDYYYAQPGSNVLWNNNSQNVGTNNAQSAYDSNNKLTLGYDNSIARFVNTGYAPAIGIQDIGECPDPTLDPDGFAEYVASFGDWHPQADSFLVGKGIYSSDYPTDLSGVERPNPPSIGAYEPKQENA